MAENDAVTPAAPSPPAHREDPAQLMQDWARYMTRALDGAEVFARQKPLVALALAFVAGVVINGLLSLLFRRK